MPRASVNRIDEVRAGVLRARVAAPPVDGAANDALLRLLAADLGVSTRRLTLRSGAAGRIKIVEVDGLTPDQVRSRWPGLDV